MKELVFKPIAGRTEEIIDAILQTGEVASCTKELYAIHLVCEELVVNVVSYAYPEGVEGYLKIQIEKADGCITLKFIDGGVPFNPLERDMPDVSLPLEERQIGGLGIFLTVQMLMMKNKIGILIESDFYENEIFYYQFRFKEAGYEVHFLSRLWGNEGITFSGHEFRAPFYCNESFEALDDEALNDYAAIIVPAGMVSDRLRYTEDVTKLPPACVFLQKVFARKDIVKGVICHGLWLFSPVAELVKGRKMTVHNNLLGDAKNYGVEYVDADVVVDGDLVSARTGGHCYLLASEILKALASK